MRENWKKSVSLVICLAMLLSAGFSAFAADYKSTDLNGMFVSEAVDLGHPITNTQFINCTFGVEDGKNMVYSTVSGKPASFVVYNLDDRKVEREFLLAGAKTCWSHGTDSKGNVYIATQSAASLFRYDPNTKKVERLGGITAPDGTVQTALYDVSFDEKDNVYFGTYPSALVMKYDVASGSFEVFNDSVFAGEKYVRNQEIHNGYMYCGNNADTPRFARIEMKTGKVEYLPNFELPSGEYCKAFSGGITSAGDYLFINFTSSEKRSITAVYKISENKWLTNEDQFVESNGFYVSPELNGKVYTHNRADNKLWAFDLKTEKYEKTEIPGSTNRNSKWIEFNTPDLPGKTLCTVQSNGNVTYINMEKGTYEDVPSNAAPQPIEVRSMEPGMKGSNTIAIGAYMGPVLTFLDDTTHQKTTIASSQVEGMGQVGDDFIVCTYPGANIWSVDCERPFETLEKTQLTTLSTDKQDRPFKVIEAGEVAAISSVPDYGILDGALTIYDPVSKKFDVYQGLIKEQSIIGLAYKDGKIYGSTAIWGGLGIDPTQTKAKLFQFDLATRKVEKEVTPQIKGLSSDAMHIGDLSFSSDGTLWGASGGTIFKIDTNTLAVTDEIKLKDYEHKVTSQRFSPYAIEWINDHVMVTNTGDVLNIVDVNTKEAKQLYPEGIGYMTVSENGNIYFTSSNRVTLYKMALRMDGNDKAYLNVDTGSSQPGNGYERVPYKNFGFQDPGFMKLSDGTNGDAKTKVVTFSGISNDDKATAKVAYGVKGQSKEANFDQFPQSIALEEKDGKNALKVQMPQKGFQIILPVPSVKFDATYTKEDNYLFKAKVYNTPAGEAETAEDVSLDPKNPKVYGKIDMGSYVRFFDQDGNKVGEDTARKYISGADKWQDLEIEIPSDLIPDEAVSMTAYLYVSSSNAVYGLYVAEPAFYKAAETSGEAEKPATLKESVILYLDHPNAYVNLFQVPVDANNAEVKPYTKDDRTLVPVRFISESIGAKVGWDDATQTVTISQGRKEIKIRINDTVMEVGNEKVTLDVPAITENDRTMLPLRAVVEALDKEVFWDDRGLIVITDGKVLDADKDKAVIDKIVSYFE